jgi:transposase-like protein
MEDILTYFKSLSKERQSELLEQLNSISSLDSTQDILKIRELQLNNKQTVCPQCGHKHYFKYGKDKGVQRYMCNGCNKTFTPYTGTWLAHIHKKELISEYLVLMQNHLSLDKTSKRLNISKKTSLDWRHKILSSIEKTETDSFVGITESDETFFLFSEKGKKELNRKSRKRGGKAKKQGASKEQIPVSVTMDRQNSKDLKIVGNKKKHKEQIENILANKITEKTILCTDGHRVYKTFANSHKIEHHALVSTKKERVKGVFHIQNVNSAHSRLKSWINNVFLGVATKYLQQYLNWFRFVETFKNKNFYEEIIRNSILDTNSWKRFKNIEKYYLETIEIPTLC